MITRVVVVFLCCLAVALAQEFTNNIRNCRNSHIDDISICLMKAIKNIQPELANGLPELGIPRLEPLRLDDVVFRQSEPPVTIEAIYQNVLVTGLTNFDIKYLDIEYGPVNRRLGIGMVIPSLTLRGQYRIGGNIFLLPIEGEGDFITILDGVIAEGTAEIVPRGDGYEMENVNIGFKIRSMKSKMDNLFQGNKILSDTVHHFLNENGQLVLDEVRPGISNQLNGFIAELFNIMFKILPKDILETLPQGTRSLKDTRNNPATNTRNNPPRNRNNPPPAAGAAAGIRRTG
uniref:Protein takeout-like n=1 Tax=Hirondellea gigas TaxID=1518452 RepID=A0A2P2HXF3_9CRUS